MAIDKIVLQATDSLFTNTEIDGTEAARMPVGTTAQRANPKVGDVRHNTDLDILEQYTSSSGWQGIASPPTISSTDVSSIDPSSDPQTIVVTGNNFDTGASATLIDGNGVALTTSSSTRNSSSQITIVYSGSELSAIDADTPEPLDIKVTNGSGLSTILEDSIGVDDNPVWSSPAAGSSQTVYEDQASTIALSATDPETGGAITYSLTSGSFPTGMSIVGSDITGTPNVNDTPSASGVQHPVTITATGADGDTTTRSFNILRKWLPGTVQEVPATSIASLYDQGTADGMIWFQNANINSGTAFQMRYASYDGRGWLETLYSQDGNVSTPWNDWLNTSWTRPQMQNYNLSSGGLNYSSGNSSFVRLHSSLNLVDVAITSKSSRTANGVVATGQNQASALPLVASNDLTGSDATSARTALAQYFGGYGEGFHAVTNGTGDYNAGWSKAGLGNFEIVLSYRNGSQTTSEWHIADGDAVDNNTYAPNIGYRNAGTNGATVGSWTNNSSAKSSTYDISSSNVLSVWVTDEL